MNPESESESNPKLAEHDHRRLGRELELFAIEDDVGPGLILWHPKGALVRKLMEDWWRAEHLARGYGFVVSPHVGKEELWRRSGHLEHYRDAMFAPMVLDPGVPDGAYRAKPMNCPFHMVVFGSRPRSWRELPLRLAELGTVYRWERSGVLHGLLRARGFTQDDAHVFCAPDQIEDEIALALRFAFDLLDRFGFPKREVRIASRPESFVGSIPSWDDAIAVLVRAAERVGVAWAIDEGGGAFYGPKIDVHVEDAHGRKWQCSTVQFDFNLPERFDLEYVGKDGARHRPLVIHRALFGSLERFFAILLEHHAGALPPWLAPVQCVVASVDERGAAWAAEVAARARASGVRVELDASADRIGAKVRRASEEKVPLVLVVGAAEAEKRSVAARSRSGELGAFDEAELPGLFARELGG
jgi:threonyl-tRNA synthetase